MTNFYMFALGRILMNENGDTAIWTLGDRVSFDSLVESIYKIQQVYVKSLRRRDRREEK